jgi:hypothetical protein
MQLADSFGLGLDAAYLILSSLGEIKSTNWFPQASGAGIQAQLFADMRVYKGLNARLFAQYQRNFFDFQSKGTDARIAGGAVDSYITAGLGHGYTYCAQLRARARARPPHAGQFQSDGSIEQLSERA